MNDMKLARKIFFYVPLKGASQHMMQIIFLHHYPAHSSLLRSFNSVILINTKKRGIFPSFLHCYVQHNIAKTKILEKYSTETKQSSFLSLNSIDSYYNFKCLPIIPNFNISLISHNNFFNTIKSNSMHLLIFFFGCKIMFIFFL